MPPHAISKSERQTGRVFAYAAGTLFLAIAVLHALAG